MDLLLQNVQNERSKKYDKEIQKLSNEYDNQSKYLIKSAAMFKNMTPVTVHVCEWKEPRGGEYNSYDESFEKAFTNKNEAQRLMKSNNSGCYRMGSIVSEKTYYKNSTGTFFDAKLTDRGFAKVEKEVKLTVDEEEDVERENILNNLKRQRNEIDKKIKNLL